ncbi:unnamed protein product [Closterium sp. NIES-54]
MLSLADIMMVVPPSPTPAKIPRRSSYFWKVSTVVLLAICGLSLCIKSISHTASSFDLFASLSIEAVPIDSPYDPPSPPHSSASSSSSSSSTSSSSSSSSSTSSPSRSLASEESEEEKAAVRKAQRQADSRELEKCPAIPDVEYGDLERFGQHYPNPLNYSRGECLCKPVHNFVVLSMQRSGSGWFETFLNSHPNISSHGEIFIVRPRRENASAVAETLDRVYNLDWSNSAAKNSCTSAVGFKWMLNQGAMEFSSDVAEYFKKHHVSVILLIRKNVLRRLISILANAYDRKTQLVGVHKSHTHSKEEAEKLATFRPNVNAKHLEGNLQRVQEMVDDALRAFNGTRRMLVYYEDVVKNKTILVPFPVTPLPPLSFHNPNSPPSLPPSLPSLFPPPPSELHLPTFHSHISFNPLPRQSSSPLPRSLTTSHLSPRFTPPFPPCCLPFRSWRTCGASSECRHGADKQASLSYTHPLSPSLPPLSSPLQILENVQRFLGVPAQELTSKQVKIHTRPLRESIENYDAVAAKLKGTEFEKFLEDESYG